MGAQLAHPFFTDLYGKQGGKSVPNNCHTDDLGARLELAKG